MITVLSLNTAIDRILVVPGFEAGGIFRTERSLVYPGGKGLNVARALRRLSKPVRVIGFLGGTGAAYIRAGCDNLGIDQEWVAIEGDTRTCVIVTDPLATTQTVLNEPGPTVAAYEIESLQRTLSSSLRSGDLLCISGSVPPGVPAEFYATVVRMMHGRGIRVLADVTGKALRGIWDARPWALAPNLDEYHAAFGETTGAEEAARRLAQKTCHALLTLGAQGVIHATEDAVLRYLPPSVQAVNAVGSGDAFVAGFLAGIEDGLPADEAVRLGIACGASNASRLEPEIGQPEEINSLTRAVTVAG